MEHPIPSGASIPIGRAPDDFVDLNQNRRGHRFAPITGSRISTRSYITSREFANVGIGGRRR